MAMRLTGLMSGMDTDSLIQELVASRKAKVDESVKAQKKLEVKQEAWKTLNSKLKTLQNKYISNMRFTTAYMKKTTKVSNNNAVSVITGEGAMNGVQELKINKLAKTAYLTGAEVAKLDGSKADAATKISELGELGANAQITCTVDGKVKTFDVTADTTISDALTWLKNDCGLNASFDEKNQRLFVSAKESGSASDFTLSGTGMALTALGLSTKNNGASKIAGQDAEIELNGATFTSNTNTFDINGLTITAMNVTAPGESITVTTQDDTDGIYDMIKNFIKEYNSIINEMDKLYNADSAKGYEPLLDEEKEAMSETEIEKWEEKIKDSILRRDSNVSKVSTALKQAMAGAIEIDGKTMYLSSFGISTMSYFQAAENEKNAYHIDGDADDEFTSGNADKLKSMISNDPDTVVSFFTQLSRNLYEAMSNQSKSVDGYRSFGSFYDDKKMKTEYDSYKSKIADLEQKLADYEDKWYKKFAAMETAMAKMQSNTSAVTALLGGS
ncbi:MAG: flagellar filament capping protein FliD [Lachnospiraceae bacterium]|nr:flagellar filament capping protein FliD [Lachnospiraceae bacterium]